jgi:hypothetical protein
MSNEISAYTRDEYMWSRSVRVHPWIGEHFEKPVNFPYKTLILGESNYTVEGKFDRSLVQECVKDDISTGAGRDTTGFCRFSTKIRRIIFGRDERVGASGLWQDVAFYNFVQSLVGGNARIRPTQEMWQQSVPAFVEIVSILRPTRILVLGKANWNNLLSHVASEKKDEFISILKVGTNHVTAGYVNHPSSSLSYSRWQPIANRVLFS